jgi:uncharacterized Tic20 family protein
MAKNWSRQDAGLERAFNCVRRGTLMAYFLGGGTAIFVVGLLGAAAYNALWDEDNHWMNLQLGHHRSVHNFAVSIVSTSVIGLVAVLAAMFFRLRLPDKRHIELILCLVSFIFALVVIILEGLGLELTKWGDRIIPSQYNHFAPGSDFERYVVSYTDAKWEADMDIGVAVPDLLNEKVNETHIPDSHDLEFVAYMQPYVRYREGVGYEVVRIASCAFNWTHLIQAALADAGSPTFKDNDPCYFRINEQDAMDCVGAWDAVLFQRYWCYLYREKDTDRRWLEVSRSQDERQKREARKRVADTAVDSIAAFYRHNTYLIAILCTSFVLLLVSVFMDMAGRKAKEKPRRRAVRV